MMLREKIRIKYRYQSKEKRKITKGNSNSYDKNKQTTPLLKKKKNSSTQKTIYRVIRDDKSYIGYIGKYIQQ